MKVDWNRKYTTIAVYAFITTISAMLFIVMMLNFTKFKDTILNIFNILSPIIYGIAIAYVLNPVLSFFEKKALPFLSKNKLKPKAKRGIGILLTYVVASIFITVLFLIIIPEVVTSITNIASKASLYINNIDTLITKITSFIPVNDLPSDIVNGLTNTLTSLMSSLYKILTDAVPYVLNVTLKFSTGLLNFILGIIISIYVFLGKEIFFAQTQKILNAILKPATVHKITEFAHESHQIFSGFISGKILDSLIIGILCFIGLSILNMPSAMLVSLIVGVTNVIPYFGPFIGAIPSALIILMDSPTKSFVFLVFILILQQFDGNILGPKILGDSTGLSAFWVVFAILLFGGLFGVLGMFVGVPTFAVIYSAIRQYVSYRLKLKNMPIETQAYASEKNQLL
ncbi:MAG: AI-2E family transporter [Oscillospiraceae bacterium]